MCTKYIKGFLSQTFKKSGCSSLALLHTQTPAIAAKKIKSSSEVPTPIYRLCPKQAWFSRWCTMKTVLERRFVIFRAEGNTKY